MKISNGFKFEADPPIRSELEIEYISVLNLSFIKLIQSVKKTDNRITHNWYGIERFFP